MSQTLEKYIAFLEENKPQFADAIVGSWKALMFENRYTIHPRRIRELGGKEIDGLVHFFRTQENAEGVQRGKRRAEEGLGTQSVLALGRNFRQFFLEASSHQDKEAARIIRLIDDYMAAYVSGFIESREQYILKEQERLRNAYIAVVKNNDDTT